MIKINLDCFVLFISTLFTSATVLSAAPFKTEDRRAVEITIGSYGSEGGFSGCIEDRPVTVIPSKAFENTVKQLHSIHPISDTTYSVQRIKSCLALPAKIKKPKTVQVSKPNYSIT